MRAVARVVAVADRRGRTVLRELRGESPLLLRQAATEEGVPTVYVVGGAAGPLAGDDLRLSVEVGPEAAVRVRTVAASVALPGRPGRSPGCGSTRWCTTAAPCTGCRSSWSRRPAATMSPSPG
ncbi:urease accessory protein UreD [Micromonospora sp. RL09-050-HVF-A]|uniref:urease accessory protein UreD n=1 Tax=Micromonospora sp. RL09-050-HVF-A TaxID=1703433 RepID=UPI002107687E|nr:urease accessory protein UreD [Micromonospora sp. RL09-050-HVF-A]